MFDRHVPSQTETKPESSLVEHFFHSSNLRLPFVWSFVRTADGHRNAYVIHAPLSSSRFFFAERAGSIIGAIKMGEEPKALFDHNISSDENILSLVDL